MKRTTLITWTVVGVLVGSVDAGSSWSAPMEQQLAQRLQQHPQYDIWADEHRIMPPRTLHQRFLEEEYQRALTYEMKLKVPLRPPLKSQFYKWLIQTIAKPAREEDTIDGYYVPRPSIIRPKESPGQLTFGADGFPYINNRPFYLNIVRTAIAVERVTYKGRNAIVKCHAHLDAFLQEARVYQHVFRVNMLGDVEHIPLLGHSDMAPAVSYDHISRPLYVTPDKPILRCLVIEHPVKSVSWIEYVTSKVKQVPTDPNAYIVITTMIESAYKLIIRLYEGYKLILSGPSNFDSDVLMVDLTNEDKPTPFIASLGDFIQVDAQKLSTLNQNDAVERLKHFSSAVRGIHSTIRHLVEAVNMDVTDPLYPRLEEIFKLEYLLFTTLRLGVCDQNADFYVPNYYSLSTI